jgi:hypothetical protein
MQRGEKIMKREIIEKLAAETGNPCVTISLNTHRTKPDYQKDRIILKNLCREAEKRVIAEFGKRDVMALLKKLALVPEETDMSLNLDSLHIFLSNKTREIVKSSLPAHKDRVEISEHFSLRPLIYAVARVEEYLVLLLSQGGTQLFQASNDHITGEVQNRCFPFGESPLFHTDRKKLSDPEAVDKMVREFLNRVDKAVVKEHNMTGQECMVICTEDNYSRLLQVADRPDIYYGYADINYNNVATHFIAAQAWKTISKLHGERVAEAVMDMKDAAAAGKVYTDLQEIYNAAKAGKGDTLIVRHDYYIPVIVKAYDKIVPVDDASLPGVIDDITSFIAWEIYSKKGKVFFADAEDLKGLGSISLKVRY